MASPPLDTLRLTFTGNVKPLANFLFYNSIIMVFTEVLKYIKQLLKMNFYCCVMYSGVECVVCCYSECISHNRPAVGYTLRVTTHYTIIKLVVFSNNLRKQINH